MRRLYRSLFRVEYPYQDALEQIRARGLLALGSGLLLAGIGGVAYQIFAALAFTPDWYQFVTPLLFGMTGLLIAVDVQQGRLLDAAFACVIGVFFASVAYNLPYGVVSPAIIVLVLPVVFAGVLFQLRAILVVSFLVALSGLLQTILNGARLLAVRPFAPAPAFTALLLLTAVTFSCAGVFSVFVDTQRRLLLRLLLKQSEVLTITRLGRVLRGQSDTAVFAASVAETLQTEFGFYFVQLFLYEVGTGLLVSRTGGKRDLGERRLSSLDNSIIVRAFREQRTIQLDDSAAPDERDEFEAAARSMIVIPLLAAGQPLGVLNIQSNQREDAFDVEIVEAIAAQVSLALQSTQRATELFTLVDERRQLNEQVNRLTRDVERLNRDVTGQVWSRFMSNRQTANIGYDWRAGEIQPGTNTTVLPVGAATMPQVTTRGDDQILTVPIVAGGQALGLLEFRTASSTPWDSRSLELVRTIAQRLALALDNIRLYDQAQTTASREKTLSQVTTRLTSKQDFDSLLRDAAEMLSQAVGASHTRIQFIAPGVAEET